MVVALFADLLVLLAATGWLYGTNLFRGDQTVEAVHVFCAWATAVLVGLHVAGLALASVRHRENLTAAMWHGRKRAASDHDIGIDAAHARGIDSRIAE